MAFDISKFAASLNVSESDTGVEQITYIDLDKLDADDNNFYTLSGIPDLASNIQLCGLQQPIRVRDGEAGRYRIVSGHRRCAAIRSLVEQGDSKFAKVPCIIEHGEASPAMQELRLIFANSSTRQLTPAEQMHQSERVTALLYQLKEEGVEFPGRMRDQVAAACNVTSTKLAELKVIREKLQEPFKTQFDQNEIQVSAAYKLARLPQHMQRDVAEAVGDRYRINYVGAENLAKYAAQYYSWVAENTCEKSGKPCDNILGMLKRTAKTQYAWQYCSGKCCLTCGDRHSCAGACKYAKELKAEEKAAENERQASLKKRNEHDAAERRKSNIRVAQRLVRAIDRTDLADNDRLALGTYSCDRTVKALRSIAAGDTGDMHFYCSNIFMPPVDGLAPLAEQLHCSTDYLLGLTEDLSPAPSVQELTPAPSSRDCENGSLCWQPLDKDHWPAHGSFVLLRGKTTLDGRTYLAAVCVGGIDDQNPFEDASDRLEYSMLEIRCCGLTEWTPLGEMVREDDET